jgi:hypothetical protein
MKKQDCSHFLEELLSAGATLSPAAAEHVKHCSECAALREMTVRFTKSGDLPEVPEALDRTVLEYAGQMRRRHSFHQLFFRRIVPFTAAAAAVVVCMVVLFPESDQTVCGEPAQDITVAAARAAADWNSLESEAYGLNYELTSCQQTLMADWQGAM